MSALKSQRHWWSMGVLLGGLLAAGLAFVWLCRSSDAIPFLPRHAGAEWIVYPTPPNTAILPAVPTSAQFVHRFELDRAPQTAPLVLRVFRSGTVLLNGQVVDPLTLPGSRWKTARTADVARWLRPGRNELLVVVTNTLGPPALWLTLQTESFRTHSDRHWQVSLAGATERAAQRATEPPAVRPGNLLHPEPGADVAVPAVQTLALLIGLITVGAVLWWRFGARLATRLGLGNETHADQRASTPTAPRTLAKFLERRGVWELGVGGLLALLWLALFWNNLPQLPRIYGFDTEGHEQYIRFLQEQKRLPLATDGWQMYQPPLYYLGAAGLLSAIGLTVDSDAAIRWLRAVTAFTALAHLGLIFLGLRELLPAARGRVLVGVVFAGFLPAHLVLAHYVTNEIGCALFTTAAIYATLRAIRASATAQLKWSVVAGAALGLALLTKFSAVLAVPVVAALFALRMTEFHRQRSVPGSTASALVPVPSWAAGCGRAMGVMLLTMLLVCGWHYARVWWQFGSPLIGNWDVASGFAWWQWPGYRTAEYFTGFGSALTHPLFAGVRSFADGLYSTLWGDGLLSSAARMGFRPPWNYEWLFAAGALGLTGSGLLLIGFVTNLIRLVRQPRADALLVVGFLGLFGAGLVYMTLRVGSYAQVKAFYALPALLPLCVCLMTGWEVVARVRFLRTLLWSWLVGWALAGLVGTWVRAGDPQQHVAWGIWHSDSGRTAEAITAFQRALKLQPQHAGATAGLADLLNRTGEPAAAQQLCAEALGRWPDDSATRLQLAIALTAQGDLAGGQREATQAWTAAPDFLAASQQLAYWHWQAGRFAEAILAARAALAANPYEPSAHAILGLSLAGQGDLTRAVASLQHAVALKPEWPMLHHTLGTLWLQMGRTQEAVAALRTAVTQAPETADYRISLALAWQQSGHDAEAVAECRAALQRQPERPDILNNLAWLLATSGERSVRNASEAVALARQACDLTGGREAALLGTLAAAHAAAGQFEEATATAAKAIQLAEAAGQTDLAARNRELLARYQAGREAVDGSSAK